ncbi:MAG: hypothetical protein JWM67_3096 [Mycobacterium sp.]|nr:hypothetical protein [Mycobacterium sp.]
MPPAEPDRTRTRTSAWGRRPGTTPAPLPHEAAAQDADALTALAALDAWADQVEAALAFTGDPGADPAAGLPAVPPVAFPPADAPDPVLLLRVQVLQARLAGLEDRLGAALAAARAQARYAAPTSVVGSATHL